MRFLLSLILLILELLSIPASHAQQSDIKDIILINSYHPTFKWTSNLTSGVVEYLSVEKNYRVSVEFMDAKRFQSEEHLQAFEEYLKKKYETIKVDGVICSDNHAFDFFLKNGEAIWGDVPMTFCGVNNIRDYNIDSLRYKGVEETINMSKTLELIHTLQPNLDTLIVISDGSLSGVIFLNQFITTAKAEFPELKYAAINAVSVMQMGSELKKFNPINKAIYLLSLYIPREGISREMLHEAEFLQKNLDVPTYGNWNFLFGDFIVGGVIMGGYEQGLHAAERLDEILKGNIDSISYLAKTPEQIIFDYPQLIKYGLSPDLLPKETKFINRPVTFLERYQTELTISLAILGLLLAVILVLLRIISLKNNADKQLLKSESRLGLAMEGAMLGLWDLDFIKNDVYLSSQIYDLLGFKNHADFNYSFNNWRELVHFEDLFQLIEVFQMHSSNIIPSFKGEVRLKNFEGNYKWFSMHGRITKFENGKPSRMIGIITNINFQKEFEEQLKLAKEKAEESDRLKSSFLANMSHEIRTPMNAILGFTDLIINGDIENDEIRDYLKHIRNSGESLLNLINDIIDFSKIQSGQLALRDETFDLNALCDNVAIVASTIIKQRQKNITITTKKGSSEESFFIVADPFRLEQVLYNLVSNSIKFTHSGDIIMSYQIVDAKTISFSVKDTGQGVAPENHDLIFERFRQVENSPTNNTGGTGLGLAITKSLLTLMGGCISIKSDLNKGATFTFTINYKPISLI